MQEISSKFLKGYQTFRQKYAAGDQSLMKKLTDLGQKPEAMVVTCCDSRVDPAVILQCDPGDLFVARNIAGIIPPCEKDGHYHGTSAALEFGIRFLQTKHLIILGHSQCAGIQTLVEKTPEKQTDFIEDWVSVIKTDHNTGTNIDDCVKHSVNTSYQNCLTFPWISKRVDKGELSIHRWFFDIKSGTIFSYSSESNKYEPLGLGLRDTAEAIAV